MTVLSPPWPPASISLKFGLESNTGWFTSPINKISQGVARQGSRWHCTNELAYLNEDNARDWEGFFWKAQDGAYSFYWNRYPFNIQPKNFPGGEGTGVTFDSTTITMDSTDVTFDAVYGWGLPVVSGGGQTGKLLSISGFIGGGTLARGDLLAFDNDRYRELHSIDDTVTADSSGNMILSLTPPIRRSPADGVPILLDGATADAGRRCAGEFVFAASFNPADVGEISVGYQFECFEKLDAST